MTGLRVAFTGGRDFVDRSIVRRALVELEPALVLVGDCPTGADLSVRVLAVALGLPCCVFQAAWTKHGKAAGPRRNGELLRLGRPDVLVAFPGGRGTADCVRQAQELRIPVQFMTLRPEATT